MAKQKLKKSPVIPAKAGIYKNLNRFQVKPGMTKISSYSPQINRRITAGLPILIVFLLISLILINLFLDISPFNKLTGSLLKNLKKSDNHLALINNLMANNQFEEARNEIMVSLQTTSDPSLFIEKLKEVNQLQAEPIKIKREISKWTEIVKNKPNYRDGYFKLAILNYQLYNNDLAKKNLAKALVIDPNYSPGLALLKLLN